MFRASKILERVKTVIGGCKDAPAFDSITQGCQLLANKGLFDPLLGYLNFSVDGGNFIALPREVRTPIKININRQPSFSRSRLFEFTLNTEGTIDGDEIGWSWADRGQLPIQNEKKLPGEIGYKCANSADNGKTCKIEGRLENGRIVTVTLAAHATSPEKSDEIIHEIISVRRDETAGECFLICGDEDEIIAQYYPDETDPSYKVIKLSKSVANVRMIFRKHVFEIKAADDIIPLHSEIAVIHAAKAARLFLNDQYELGQQALDFAVQTLKEEQAAGDSPLEIANQTESPTSTDNTILSNDSIIAADIYDSASEIFGPIGRPKLFDRITNAIDILGNKSNWDSKIHAVDIYTTDRSKEINVCGSKGHGYFVLPRFVEAPVSINFHSSPQMPRNRWFEFHLNGVGESNYASGLKWDDAGETCIITELPREEKTGKIIPVKVIAIPQNEADDGKEVWIYGIERLSSGREVEIFRNGKPGWQCPCKYSKRDPGRDAPDIVRIDRIRREQTTGFVEFVAIEADSHTFAMLGCEAGEDYEDDTRRVVNMVKTVGVDDVILLGDCNPPTGQADSLDSNLGKLWRSYIYPFLGDTEDAPLWAGEVDATENHIYNVLGNEDWGDSPGDPSPILNYFSMQERYYTKVFGEVQIYFLSSHNFEEDGNTIGSVQYQWLVDQLAASTAKWQVVCMHHSPRTSSPVGPFPDLDWNFEDLGVHAVIASHAVNYERWEESGVIYFMAGTGGQPLGGFEDPGIFSKKRLQMRGALFMEANKSHLRFIFRDENGVTRDTKDLFSDVDDTDILLGFWYPDEVDPKYRRIKLSSGKENKRIRVLFRKRTNKITSMYDPIPLRSHVAVENMMRGLQAMKTDPEAGTMYEQMAVKHLEEASIKSLPSDTGVLQFDEDSMPGHNMNIM